MALRRPRMENLVLSIVRYKYENILQEDLVHWIVEFMIFYYTSEDDGVKRIGPPLLYEVNRITKSEARMAAKYNARLQNKRMLQKTVEKRGRKWFSRIYFHLSEIGTKSIRINTLVVLQSTSFHQITMRKRFFREVDFVLFIAGQPVI